MKSTTYIKINAQQPDQEAIQRAAHFIRQGELVAFPTETVYGLGADALNEQAVEKIFIAKGRPATQALLIHVSSIAQVYQLAADIPRPAQLLMEAFWPGPLSLILPAGKLVPSIVRAGKATVGFRMPAHPVARAFIDAAGALAAPSANLYGRPSPTSADRVRQDLHGRIAAVLDAGQTGTGMESTVLDLCARPYRVLRRGGVSVEEVERLLEQNLLVHMPDQQAAYHLKVKILLASDSEEMKQCLQQYSQQGKVGLVSYDDRTPITGAGVIHYRLDLYGEENLVYTILRNAEEQHLNTLVFAPLPEALSGRAVAVADRIRRAAGLSL